MEELILTKLYDVITQACGEERKTLTWRGKLNPNDNFDWKITAECIIEEEECLVRIKKRIVI